MFFRNPFSPGKRLTSPALFAGRADELRDAVQRVYQATSENAVHTMITGERGIGKSSFSSQLQGILKGEEEFLKLIDATRRDLPEKFVVVEHVAQAGQGPGEIALGLLRRLESDGKVMQFLKSNVELKFNLGPLTASTKQKSSDTTDIISQFVEEVAKALKAGRGEIDALVFVVDEVDRVAGKKGVGTFFKVVTEQLSAAGINNVAFVLVGILGAVEKLIEDHASVGRVFLPQPIPLLEKSETASLVTKALDGSGVSISDEALERIHHYSGGYPNAVHLIGEAAFAIAKAQDETITRDGVESAVERVIRQATPEDYAPNYLKFQGRTRKIVRFLASHEEVDVPARDIVAGLAVKSSDISVNLETLLRKDVVVKPLEGVYRLRDPLFREYVRLLVTNGEEPLQRRPKKRDGTEED